MSTENLNINPENVAQKIFSYKNYFKGTKILKGNFNDEDLKIESNMRVFKSKEKDCGYDEIFLNEDSEKFGGISNQISFLYPHNIRVYQNKIGFWYYKEEPLSSKNDIPYFTLIKCGVRKFFILEKESETKDTNNNSFIIPDLDCFNIIITIIKAKIKKDDNYLTYANSLVEMLGFIYACKYSEKRRNNIQILHPFIPSPFLKESLNEEKTDIEIDKYYIEPIIYNKHISLLFFYYKKKDNNYYLRKNILFDMSSAHYKCIIKNDPIFPEEFSYWLTKFPSNNIQIGSSCSMWFYASLLFLIKEEIEIPFNNNTLYKIIEKLYDLFNIMEKDISVNKIINRNSENIVNDEFVSYKLVLKTFIDVDTILEQFNFIKNTGPGGLGEYQKIFLELKNSINILKINNRYYEKIFKEKIISDKSFNAFYSSFYSAEKLFLSIIKAKKEKWEYLNINSNANLNLNDLNKNLEIAIKDFSSVVKELKCKYSNISDKHILYSSHKLHELYFDNSDIFLSIMDN